MMLKKILFPVNINRLRKKLDSIGLNDFIRTKSGSGYIIGS